MLPRRVRLALGWLYAHEDARCLPHSDTAPTKPVCNCNAHEANKGYITAVRKFWYYTSALSTTPTRHYLQDDKRP